jgi:hypothetical protein
VKVYGNVKARTDEDGVRVIQEFEVVAVKVKCTQVLRMGSFGPTVEDEVLDTLCGRDAVWVVSRPDPTVRPILRCDECVAPYRGLRDVLPDIIIEPLHAR